MRDFRDAKAMAQTLRDALKVKSISVSHSESLELVAKTLGFHDWNVLSAAIQVEPAHCSTARQGACPATERQRRHSDRAHAGRRVSFRN